ncbi:hypothetical protein L9F63_013905, partial [Diploptera punctata]
QENWRNIACRRRQTKITEVVLSLRILVLLFGIMANVDKGRSKWEDNSQGDQDMRLKEDMKCSRRGKPQVELYRPGSGPLRKSGDNDAGFFDSARRSKSSIENSHSKRLSKTSKRNSESRDLTDMSKNDRELTDIDEKMRNIHVSTPGPGTSSKPTMNDVKRKNRKPEQALYVPKPLAQAIAIGNKSPVDNVDSKIISNNNCLKEKNKQSGKDIQVQRSENWDRNGGRKCAKEKDCGGGKCNEGKSHPMRYSGNRRNCHTNDSDIKTQDSNHLSSWNSEASVSSQSYPQRRNDFSREIRQASEPRVLPPTSLPLDVNRMRDTRSVEPAGRGWNGEKLQSKPPSGRRGSMKDSCLPTNITKTPSKSYICYDSLPPRLKKKFLAENMAANTSYIGTTSEDAWDGSTVTFQGSGLSYQHVQPPLQHDGIGQQQNFPEWSHTLPNPRTRGRGRLRPDEVEMEKVFSAVARYSRSLTPDPSFESGEHERYRKRTDNNPSEAGEIYQNQKRNENKLQMKGNATKPQEVALASSSTDVLQNPPSPKLLDWGEEVEQMERLEAEGVMSDVMTRSSSLASLQDKSQTHPPRERRRRRRRSLSRDNGTRAQSKEQNRGYSGDRNNRGSSQERNYGSHRNRGHSRERNSAGENKDFNNREKNVRPQSNERNFRGQSQDRVYRGQSRDRNNRAENRIIEDKAEKEIVKFMVKKKGQE